MNRGRGQVDHVRRRGKSHVVSVEVGNPQRIEVRSDLRDRPSPEEEVTVLFRTEATVPAF